MKGDITFYEKLLSSDGQQNRNKPHLIHYFQQIKKDFCDCFHTDACS